MCATSWHSAHICLLLSLVCSQINGSALLFLATMKERKVEKDRGKSMKTLKTGRKPSQPKQMRLTRTLNRAKKIWQAFPSSQAILARREAKSLQCVNKGQTRQAIRQTQDQPSDIWLAWALSPQFLRFLHKVFIADHEIPFTSFPFILSSPPPTQGKVCGISFTY